MARRGMGGLGGIMKQAQAMQKKMKKMQEELEQKEIKTTAGGGAIEVVITGKKKIKSIKIDPEIVDKDDVETLEDLTMAAINEAVNQAEDLTNNEMSQITGGMNLPGGLF